MSYDLLAWLPKTRGALSVGAAYLCLAENVPCAGLRKLPKRRVMAALQAAWGDEELPADWLVCGDRVAISVSWSDVHELVPKVSAALASLGLTVFDPQRDAPSAEDEQHLVAMRAAVETETQTDAADVALRRREAETGDLSAMNELGNCYSAGDVVKQDHGAAVSWYRKAAECGYVPAELNLIRCYLDGDGVTRDEAEARRLYEQLLPREACVTAFALGEMYAEGIGGPALRERAIEMFTLARTHRHPEAYLALKALGAAPDD